MPVAVSSAPSFPTYTDVWAAIQAQNTATPTATAGVDLYHHRSLSQLISLETCTESLGSETGSDVFFYSDIDSSSFSSSFSDFSDDVISEEEEELELEKIEPIRHDDDDDDDDKVLTVNYHCSISKKSSPVIRSFPPPLPSISRRDGPCLSMRQHRRDGRLVMEAVHVPSQNYLHAERHDGRLLLSFIHSSSTLNQTQQSELPIEEEEEQQQQETPKIPMEENNKICLEQEEEEQEEVEVLDRGTVVELKMSTQPHRSSFVINKFVGGLPESQEPPPPSPSLLSTPSSYYAYDPPKKIKQTPENKMLFMSKGRNRGELLHRCSHLWRPLLFWEPYCIATSS